MTHLERTQVALRELGDAPPHELAEFIRSRFGANVQPKAVLILKASVVAESLRQEFLRKSREAAPGQAGPEKDLAVDRP